MSHISSNIYKSYCTKNKGKLTADLKKTIRPGTAVFTGTDSSKPHIGLYVGNGTVIEASGSKVGVITTDIGNSKWKYWGQLKDVNYNGGGGDQPVPKGKAIVTGKNLALRQGPGTEFGIRTRIPMGNTVKLEEIPEGWTFVSYGGKSGFVMDKYIKKG